MTSTPDIMNVDRALPPGEPMAPLLQWDVRLSREDGALLVESGDLEYRFEGVDPDRALALVTLFDGKRTLTAAAEAAGVSMREAEALARHVVESDLGLHVSSGPAPDLEPAAFASAFRRVYPGLKTRLFSHPLWSGLGSGELPRAVFMGWLIENYHFIEGVNDRLALAAASCADPKIQPFFVKHYVEEWDHASYFLTALEVLGVDGETVMASRPLPSTLAILNHMRKSARRDPLEYAACSGFLESTGSERTDGMDFYADITAHYASDRPHAIHPLIEHVRLDAAYQHNTVLEDICSKIDRVSVQRASAALNAALLLVETIEMWSTDILRSYNRPSFVPRTGLQRHRPPAPGGGAAFPP